MNKAEKCGRGPWCGGGMRQPIRPLERLGNKGKDTADAPASEERGGRRKRKLVGKLLPLNIVMTFFSPSNINRSAC